MSDQRKQFQVRIFEKNSKEKTEEVVFSSDNIVLVHIWLRQNIKTGDFFKTNKKHPEKWDYLIGVC